MKAVLLSFKQMLLFMRRDKMMPVACLIPLLAGVFLKLTVPALENWARTAAGGAVIAPYYGLIDTFYSMLTPLIFCFVAGMVMLEERDDRIETYLTVTSLGRRGYLVSRVLLPALAGFAASAIGLPFFRLSALTAGEIIFLSAAGALQGIIIVLLIVTLSKNKLEGMAVAKAASLIAAGAAGAYLITNDVRYALSLLPAFWTGETIYKGNPLYMLPALLCSLLWIFPLLKRYLGRSWE